MQRKPIELHGVSISLDRLIESVWQACQREDIPPIELSQRQADLLQQSADMIYERLRQTAEKTQVDFRVG